MEIAIDKIDDPIEQLRAAAGQKKPKQVRVSAHLLVMGDGDRTWIGFAADRDKLSGVMAAAKGTTPGPDTLAQHGHLGALKRDRHTGGAFFSIKGMLAAANLLKFAIGMAPAATAGPANKFLALLGQLPNQGQTPIVLFTDADAGATPSSSLRLEAPKEALADIGFLVNQMLAYATQRQP